jgi:hypothetical protein
MSNETKQTAVEWLEEIVNKNGIQMSDYFKFTFEQAKEMEKKQIEDAYQAGQDNVDYTACFVDENGLENYYEQTYGGNK